MAENGHKSVQEAGQQERILSGFPATRLEFSIEQIRIMKRKKKKKTVVLNKLPSQNSSTEENARIWGPELEDNVGQSHRNKEKV